MVDNDTHLINIAVHIPNRNRSYYTSRSKPPSYASMISLIAEEKGKGFSRLMDLLRQRIRIQDGWMVLRGSLKSKVNIDDECQMEVY